MILSVPCVQSHSAEQNLLMGEILPGFYQFERQCMGFRFRLQNFRHLHGKFIRLHSWRLALVRTDCPQIPFTEFGHHFICGPSQAPVALSVLVCCGPTVWGFSSFQSTLNSESCVLQPTQALALQDTPTPHEGHATGAKPAKGSGRAAEGGGSQTWHTAPLADSTEQLQQQRIPRERPRLVSEAISWVTPRESQEGRNTGVCRQPSTKLPQWAGELSYLTGQMRQTGSVREWFISLESRHIKYVRWVKHWKSPCLRMTCKGSLKDGLRNSYTTDPQNHRRETPDQTFIHPMLQKNMHFRGLSLLFSCEPKATLSCILFSSRIE